MSAAGMTTNEGRLLLSIIGPEKFGEFMREAWGWNDRQVQHTIESLSRSKTKKQTSARRQTSQGVCQHEG